MLHAVIVCDYAHPFGGAEKVAIDSAKGLARKGVQVHFVAAVGPVDPALTASGVTVHLADVPELAHKGTAALLITGMWSKKCAALTARVLAAQPRGQTVVHVHCWQRALTASTLRACTESGHPVLFTLHDYGTACPNQGFFDYRRSEICTRKALGADCLRTHCDTRTYVHKLWRAGRTAVQQVAAAVPGSIDDVIYLSTLSRQVLEPYFHAGTRWHALRNPIDAVHAQRVPAEQNRSFLFIGQLKPEKGVRLFAEATKQSGLPGVVVGDGPLMAELREQAPHLTLRGKLSPAEVRVALAQSRALVFPSIWYEGQPLVVQEAMASGVPVLIADRTAAREAVIEGETGYLFRHQDADHLAAQMKRMADDDATIAAMSERVHSDYWRDPPTLAAHLSGLLAVYEQCLARAPRAAAS